MNEDIQKLVDTYDEWITKSCEQLKVVRHERSRFHTINKVLVAMSVFLGLLFLVTSLVLQMILPALGSVVFFCFAYFAVKDMKRSWKDWTKLEKDCEDHLEKQITWRDEAKELLNDGY
jgi:hypothetical protein